VISVPDALPITLVLAVLVSVFLSLERQAPVARVRLWAYAWSLTFLHFFAQAMESQGGIVQKILTPVDFGALELSALVFLASLVFQADERSKRIGFITALGLPFTLHAFAIGFHVGSPALWAALLVPTIVSAVSFLFFAVPRRRFHHTAGAVVVAAAGSWAVHAQARGDILTPTALFLAMSFCLSGVQFWKIYRRSSLGVITTTIGFIAWGAEYPIALGIHDLLKTMQVNLDFWNVPRILVALGMVLTLLEEKTRVLEEARGRAQAESLLLQRLSQITSRLLAGNDPGALCGEVATAITEASSFRRAALLLLGEDRKFYLAGLSGFTPQEAETLEMHSSSYALEAMKRREQTAGPAEKSFRMSETGDLMLVPMVSWRGSDVGCLYVADSRWPGGPDSREMVNLQVFVSDLAVTFENVRLHQQLVRSEKLAGLGQLVAGVAHELNNPLTGIIGYADLLAEEVEEANPRRRIEKLGNEARRMKRILDGLLRFGRQNSSAARSTPLEPVLRDVVQLREYHLRVHGISLDMQFEPVLAPLGISEDELKQLLLNILNNAIDAVEESAKREIRIRASSQSGRAIIRFEDTGPGFSDLARAFDPFYTTKPVGKGTGLGLSICYGIMQECNGEITLSNLNPYGASVTIDLPFAVPQPALAQPASAIWW
jgi:C4-dicarboxylate-specific signal transduction histidine kinase